MLTGREVIVVGAGVAGLATALAMALRGAAVRVLERAPGIAEVGAGIQISPNGLAVLDALGVGAAVREVALEAEAVELRDGPTGRRVLRLDLRRHGRGRIWLFVHRARLIEALAAAARSAGVSVEPGAGVQEVAERADGISLGLEDGGWREAALVVAADGLHSRVREAVGEREPARFTGQVAWRALVPGGGAPTATVHMGPGRHLVTYPLAGGLRNIVAVEERSRWAEESWTATDDPGNLRAAFAGFSPEVRALLDRVEAVNLWGLFRHPVARRWYGDRIALVGDAAHPTLPFLAQGANLALEDAWALADCLARAAPSEALPAYQARRRARAVRVVEAASANARNYHLRLPPVRLAAHGVLRAADVLAPSLMLRRLDWLYGHDETRAG